MSNLSPVSLLFLLFVMALTIYILNRIFQRNRRILEVDTERIDEELNLLTDEIKFVENTNLRMRNSLERIVRLKHMVEDYSHTLSEEDILDSIIKNSFELFKHATRVLLYLVDIEKQELKLARSRKRNSSFSIKAKKSDVFD